MYRKRSVLIKLTLLLTVCCLMCASALAQSADSVRYSPESVRAILQKADSLYRADDHNTAVDFYQAALNQATALEDKPLIATVCSHLAEFVTATSYAAYAVRYRERAASIYRELGERVSEAEQLLALGPVYLNQQRFGMATGAYNRVLEIAGILGDTEAENAALVGLAKACRGEGDIETSREHCRTALEYFRNSGDSVRVADILLTLAGTHSGPEEAGQAAIYRREAAAIYSRLGMRQKEAQTLLDLGLMWQSVGQADSALANLGRARTLFADLGNNVSEITILAYVSVTLFVRGDTVAMQDSLRAVAEIIEFTTDPYRQAWGAYFVASQLKTVGAWNDAQQFYGQAVELYRQLGDQMQSEGLSLAEQGLCLVESGQIDSGLVILQQALQFNRDIGETIQETLSLEYIGLAYSRAGRLEEAIDHLQQAREIHRLAGALSLEAANLRTTGSIQTEHGLYQVAAENYQEALELHNRFDYPTEKISLLGALAEVYLALQEYEKARQYCLMALDLVDKRHLLRYRNDVTALCERIHAQENAAPGEN